MSLISCSIKYWLYNSMDDFVIYKYPAAYVSHEESRRILKKKPLATTSRWNPTTEQLLALEELCRHGTRSPTAEQIQQIAAYLRRFGRIEEKNVFYWFQNHKARESQKRRRTEMASLHLPDQQQHHSNKSLDKHLFLFLF
jgi:hypothetical protein